MLFNFPKFSDALSNLKIVRTKEMISGSKLKTYFAGMTINTLIYVTIA